MDALPSLIGKEMGMNIKINTVGQRLGHYMNIFIRDAAKSCLQGNERTRRHPCARLNRSHFAVPPSLPHPCVPPPSLLETHKNNSRARVAFVPQF